MTSSLLDDLVVGFNWFIVAYFIALNTIQLVLIVLASLEIVRSTRWVTSSGYDEIFANPLTPGISVLVPAYNESAGIVDALRAMLGVRYPMHEVVVVDDGSTDDTFELLRVTFQLIESPRPVPDHVPTVGRVLSCWVTQDGEPLVVVRKENAGRRADALNVALNYARHELVCMIDADSILEEDALLRVAKPFVDEPGRVVATGGVVRAANGATIYRGRLVDVRAPHTWIERIQVVEYLRSFLLSRSGWSRISGLLIISGAFGLFRKELIYELGGLDSTTLAEDADLVAGIHQYMRTRGQEYSVVFVPDPVCWTEVPSTYEVLARQRRRWSHGLAQLLWKFKSMIGNPKYGVLGLITLPFYVLFEALGPVVELLGLGMVIIGWVLGLLNWPFVFFLVLASIGYGVLLSMASILVEELAFHRYGRVSDLAALIAATVVENLGFRQLHAWWRLRGLWAALRGRPGAWGTMTRIGFGQEQPTPTASAGTSSTGDH